MSRFRLAWFSTAELGHHERARARLDKAILRLFRLAARGPRAHHHPIPGRSPDFGFHDRNRTGELHSGKRGMSIAEIGERGDSLAALCADESTESFGGVSPKIFMRGTDQSSPY